MKQRNHDQEFQDNEERLYSYGFDHIVREHLLRRWSPFMATSDVVLEVGAYLGDMTAQLLGFYEAIDVIEASPLLAGEVEARFPGRVTLTTGLIEEVEPRCRYDTIFLVHTLEHIDDPVMALRKLGSWLTDEGSLLIAVPNANALSRQIAVHMGLIPHNCAVTEGERQQGHRRTYSIDTLLADIRQAGLDVRDFGGVIVKPMANYQFDLAISQGIVSGEFVAACESLARVLPDLSASVFAVCRPDH